MVMQVPLHQEYGVALYMNQAALPVRANLPGVGWLMTIMLAVMLVALLLFVLDWLNKDEKAKRWAWNLFRASVVLQGVIVAAVFYNLKTITDIAQRIPGREFGGFGQWLAKQMSMTVPPERQPELAQSRVWRADRSIRFVVDGRAICVEAQGCDRILTGAKDDRLAHVQDSWRSISASVSVAHHGGSVGK
jgi:hypothetical protein